MAILERRYRIWGGTYMGNRQLHSCGGSKRYIRQIEEQYTYVGSRSSTRTADPEVVLYGSCHFNDRHFALNGCWS